MSILDNILGTRLKESEKIRTIEKSLELIDSYISEDRELMDIESHRKYTKFENKENTYQFTVRVMSLDFLIKIAKDNRVKNVYFTSRHSHPGGSLDSISLMHNIY